MKAVLISIQPQWCELIATGKKIPEARSLNAKTCSDECGEKLYMRNKNRIRAERRRMKEVSSQNENA